MEALGPQGAVFLNPVVQDDLKLSNEQKQKLQHAMMTVAPGFQKVVEDTQGLPQPEREKKRSEFRQEANQRLSAALANVLKPDQQKRLRQIVLQQKGPFALSDPAVAAELRVSDAQRMQFMTLVQETQQRFEALQQKAQSSGNPAEMQHEAAGIRKEQETKIAALLTDAQKKQWKAMLGKPLALEGDAGLQARLQRKVQQVQAGVQRWQGEGRDPSRVGEIMQGFGPLMQEGRPHEAEAVLDRALEVLGPGAHQE
jgi:hypothetical protein